MGELQVVMRADGGPGIGIGHLRRCVALGEALRARGAAVTFVVPDHNVLVATVAQAGFAARTVEPEEAATLAATRAITRELGATAIVLDGYDFREEALRSALAPLTVVIDDLADRELLVDVVVNGNMDGPRLAYRVAPHTLVLAGSRYAILRAEFADSPERPVRSRVDNVLITLGGGDHSGLTPALLGAVSRAVPQAEINAVLGPMAPPGLDGATAAAATRARVHRAPASLRTLMLQADLAVSGGGQTLYELAALGVPAVTIELAENQRLNIQGLAALGGTVSAGKASAPDLASGVAGLVAQLDGDPGRRQTMARAGRGALDGRGAGRVADVLVAKLTAARSVSS